MFFPNNKIFVHIPKTGGSSLEYAILKKYYPKELDYSDTRKVEKYAFKHFSIASFFEGAKKAKGPFAHTHRPISAYNSYFNLDNFDSFAIIRNPIEQAISLYNQQRFHALSKGLTYPSLNDWFLDKDKHGLSNNHHWLDQYSYIFIGNEVKINKIFLYERYSEAQDYVEKAFDVKIDRNLKLWETKYTDQILDEEPKEYFRWKFSKSVDLYNNLNF